VILAVVHGAQTVIVLVEMERKELKIPVLNALHVEKAKLQKSSAKRTSCIVFN
tara:strand:+ start:3368 stop:3526 length:159 start_codon:yes stop_codon:yes gene_type:complete